MNPLIKIPRSLLGTAMSDLERPHPFAWERLGFLSCHQIASPLRPILLCHDYHPIPDDQYLEDYRCGARIGEAAIQAAMQRVLESGSSQIWIHTHGRRRSTAPSTTDCREGPNLVRCLSNVNRNLHHGWAVISDSEISGQICNPDGGLVNLHDLTVVGWPMTISRHHGSRNSRSHRLMEVHQSRQSFLGPDAPRVIEYAKLGIIGLGGGGSHINQQLAHIGFKHVVLADADRMERTNLNRLVGATLDDVRKSNLKTRIAERVFRSIRPDAVLDSTPGRWEDKLAALGDCDLIFGCLDGFASRRDLERFCRSRMIPLLDIGMKVQQSPGKAPQIFGQVVVSMPGSHCLRCMNVVTEENLAQEAGDYGAGQQPQVVWSNGILASAAVGFAMQLLTGWSRREAPPCRLDMNGFGQTLTPSNLVNALQDIPCCHYGSNDLGDPRLIRL